MFHDLSKVVGLLGVQDIEKVVPGRPLALGVCVREVAHEDGVLGHERVYVLDAQLLVVRDLDVPDLVLLVQVLVALYHLLQPVLVAHGLMREVELLMLIKTAMRLDREMDGTYYCRRSSFDLNLYLSSYALMFTKLRFFDSVICSRSIWF